MTIHFSKYQGTGNDFIIIDNRDKKFPSENVALIEQLCDRRFGIGADGLILLENDNSSDFKMVYFNSDGNQSSMCGNGGRCIVAFAKKLGIIQNQTTFIATDGLHFASFSPDGIVALQMKEVEEVQIFDQHIFLNTGSPHHVQQVENLNNFDVKNQGREIRNSSLYGKAGSNINFVAQENPETFSLRTYERGVEDETLSCGTGATAVAIAMHASGKTASENIKLNVQGGKLEVSFQNIGEKYTTVYLKGPATFVFEGKIEV